MTEHIDWEGFLRFEIYTEYICTDHFQSFLSGALEALDNIFFDVLKFYRTNEFLKLVPRD